MKQEKLNEIIAEHAKWLNGLGDNCADLSHAHLVMADLHGTDLSRADLHHVNLHLANLEGAKLPTGICQIVGAGSSNRCTTYDSINDRVICGCWDDEKGNHLDSFARRIEEIYGTNGEKPNPMFYTEYMTAIEFFKTMKMCVLSTVLRG